MINQFILDSDISDHQNVQNKQIKVISAHKNMLTYILNCISDKFYAHAEVLNQGLFFICNLTLLSEAIQIYMQDGLDLYLLKLIQQKQDLKTLMLVYRTISNILSDEKSDYYYSQFLNNNLINRLHEQSPDVMSYELALEHAMLLKTICNQEKATYN